MKTFMTEAEAGKFLKLSRSKLVDLRNNYGLPHIRIGSAVRYELDEISRWLMENCRPRHLEKSNEEDCQNEHCNERHPRWDIHR